MGEPGRLGQGIEVLSRGRRRHGRVNQLHRSFLEDARGVAFAITLDLAPRGIGGLAANAQSGEGGRVYPGRVAVVGLDGDRPVGHHPVEEVAMRHPAGEHVVEPAAAKEPVPVGVSPGKLGDPPEDPVDGRFLCQFEVAQAAGAH